MNYSDACTYIDSLKTRGIMPGLDSMRALCAALGNPQNGLDFIHIAGTNGKGSVGTFLSEIFCAANYTVGRYYSPCVSERRDILRLNGRIIAEDDYAYCASLVKDACDRLAEDGVFPTAFEFETAMAFVYFRLKGCDICIVECGMGGALDATNVLHSRYAVFTHISLDHTAFLGDSLAEIAQNKAGIVKGTCLQKAFSSPQADEVIEVLQKHCDEYSVPLLFTDEVKDFRLDGLETVFDYDGLKDLRLRMAGAFQPQNAALAYTVAKDFGIAEEYIRQGLYSAVWEYRFEITGHDPYWVFDGAHNPDAASQLARSLERYFPDKRLCFIIGVFADKDYSEILRLTAPLACRIACVTPPTPRGLDAKLLADIARLYCADTLAASSYSEAVSLCENYDCDAVIVFGSLSFLKYIKKDKN